MAVKTNEFMEGILPKELMNILSCLASNWGDAIDKNSLKINQLSGAMTNEVYTISWPTEVGNSSRTVLVRIYGEGVDLFFDREDEIRTFKCLSMRGYGPKLLGQFLQGRVEEFIHARTLSAVDLRDPIVSALIAAKLREFHNLDMPGSKKVILWDRMRKWLHEAKNLCSAEHAREFHLDNLDEEIAFLEKSISEGNPRKIGFCHNDLQYGNIMIDDETQSITIIDYEYANYNPVAYDIANHFCEMAANYHTDTPHVLEYSKYPGLEERQRFIRQYLMLNVSIGLEERQRFIRQYLIDADHEASNTEIEQLVDDVEKYTLANHIFWGLWGIISGYVNHIEFDYMEYGRQRFEQYWSRKHGIFNEK